MYGLPKKAAKPAEPVKDQDERRIWETPDNKTGGVRGGISQGKERPVNPGHTCGNRHFRRRGYDGDPAGGEGKGGQRVRKGSAAGSHGGGSNQHGRRYTPVYGRAGKQGQMKEAPHGEAGRRTFRNGGIVQTPGGVAGTEPPAGPVRAVGHAGGAGRRCGFCSFPASVYSRCAGVRLETALHKTGACAAAQAPVLFPSAPGAAAVPGRACVPGGLSLLKRGMNGTVGTGPAAVAAADAFGAVGLLPYGNVQLAGFLAFPAGDALILLHPEAVQCEPVERAVDCAQRAEIPAERPVNKHRQHQQPDQDGQLPGIQPADCGAEPRIGGRQRDAAQQGAAGADIFAEPGGTLADEIHSEHGQQNDEDRQDPIFQPFQEPVARQALPFFHARDFVK